MTTLETLFKKMQDMLTLSDDCVTSQRFNFAFALQKICSECHSGQNSDLYALSSALTIEWDFNAGCDEYDEDDYDQREMFEFLLDELEVRELYEDEDEDEDETITTLRHRNTLTFIIDGEFKPRLAKEVQIKRNEFSFDVLATDGYDQFANVTFEPTLAGMIQAKNYAKRLLNKYAQDRQVRADSARLILDRVRAQDKHGLLKIK